MSRVPLALELAADLAVQGLLISYSIGEDCVYGRQEEVGTLLLELPHHRPLVVFAGYVAGLAVADRLLRSSWPRPARQNTA